MPDTDPAPRPPASSGGPELRRFGRPPWAHHRPGGSGNGWQGVPPWVESAPWAARRDELRQRHREWPGTAVISALVFHLLSARAAAHNGAVLRPMDLLSYALLLVGPIALCWVRRAPIAVLAIAAAGTIGFTTFAEPRWMYAVAPVLALFTAVRAGHRRNAVLVAGAAYPAYLLITLVLAGPLGVPEQVRPDMRVALLTAGGLVLTVVLGSAAKVRSEVMAQVMKARAEQKKAQAEQERRQASEERLRIARELHDVLGHHLSLINVQAGVGLHLMDNRPEQAREALAAIKTASAEALREVRAVLGVLRPEEEAAPRQPALGLARLADLTADVGLTVTTAEVGEARELPAEVDRAAYRIIQEALTNVRRHAAAGVGAQVTVDYRPAELMLTVRDDGPSTSAPGPSGGSGVTGMRARAETLGGTLEAGPLPDGGYLVCAVLPTKGTA